MRTDKTLREVLRRRAATRGRTISDLVREILERAHLDRPLALRMGQLRGRRRLPASDDHTGSRQRRGRRGRS